jgi:hypothetical protein
MLSSQLQADHEEGSYNISSSQHDRRLITDPRRWGMPDNQLLHHSWDSPFEAYHAFSALDMNSCTSRRRFSLTPPGKITESHGRAGRLRGPVHPEDRVLTRISKHRHSAV